MASRNILRTACKGIAVIQMVKSYLLAFLSVALLVLACRDNYRMDTFTTIIVCIVGMKCITVLAILFLNLANLLYQGVKDRKLEKCKMWLLFNTFFLVVGSLGHIYYAERITFETLLFTVVQSLFIMTVYCFTWELALTAKSKGVLGEIDQEEAMDTDDKCESQAISNPAPRENDVHYYMCRFNSGV